MNKFRFFILLVIFGLVVAVVSFLRNFNIDSRQKGILLSSGILKDSLFKSPIVVSYDGKQSTKYRYQSYVSPSEKEVQPNLKDKSYKEYGGCDWPIYLDSSKNELVMADAVDVGSILEITKVCKINVINGDVIGTFIMPYKETVQLFDYYVDANNRKIVFDDAKVVLDIDSMSGKIIEIPGWDDFDIVSKKIFDGKIVIANNSNKEESAAFFVVYDINTNEASKVMQIDFENSSFVDISPNSKHILFRHFVRDSNLTGNGNGYNCYVVVALENPTKTGNICSIDSAGNPRSFSGWVE